jgi:uncharacterized protein (DUF885 family)
MRSLLWLVLLPVGCAGWQGPAETLRELVATDRAGWTPPGEWPDLTLKALRAAEERDRESLKVLAKISRTSLQGEDRTLYDLYERELKRRAGQFRLRMYFTPWYEDPRFEPGPLSLAMAMQEPLQSLGDAENRVRRIGSLAGYVDQSIALLREGLRAGVLPPDWLFRVTVASVRGLAMERFSFGRAAGVTSSWFYLPFAGASGLTTEERKRIQEEARTAISDQAIGAARKFRDFLEGEYVPACSKIRGLPSMRDGPDIYRAIVSEATGTTLDPKQIHDFGLREVARIREAIGRVAIEMGRDEPVDDFLAEMSRDPGSYFANGDELLAAYKTALARVPPLLPKVVRTLPKAKLEVMPVRHGGVAATYRRDGGESSTSMIFVEVSKVGLRPKFEVLPLMLHEGLPGHHLQLSLSPLVPDVRERMMRRTAFVEGWGLYAESLGYELGLYTDPVDRFGQLSMELMRAVRLVVDTGIHEYGWSEERATEYFTKQTGKSAAAAATEVSRSQWPGSLLPYKVGAERIRLMRERAARTVGAKFDARGFHDALIRWNPLPIDVLEKKLDDCLADTACRAEFQ